MYSACKYSDCLFNKPAPHIKNCIFRIISINFSDQNTQITIKVPVLLTLALQTVAEEKQDRFGTCIEKDWVCNAHAKPI